MSCLINANIRVACTDEATSGGIVNVYVASRDDITSFTAGTPHRYTAVTMASTANVFYEFETQDFSTTATFTSTTEDNGSKTVALNVEGFIPNQDGTKGAPLQDFLCSCKAIMVVKYANGNSFVYGYDEDILKKAALSGEVDGEVGAGLGDANGYTFRGVGTSREIPRQFAGVLPLDGGSITLYISRGVKAPTYFLLWHQEIENLNKLIYLQKRLN